MNPFMYYVQSQARAGNWVDELGVQEHNYNDAVNYMRYLKEKMPEGNFRIVKRTDEVVAATYV